MFERAGVATIGRKLEVVAGVSRGFNPLASWGGCESWWREPRAAARGYWWDAKAPATADLRRRGFDDDCAGASCEHARASWPRVSIPGNGFVGR